MGIYIKTAVRICSVNKLTKLFFLKKSIIKSHGHFLVMLISRKFSYKYNLKNPYPANNTWLEKSWKLVGQTV